MRAMLRLAALVLATAALAAGESQNAFVNHTVSSRTIALNQIVRVEFTTLPRQVDMTDAEIVRRLGDAVGLGAAAGWRLMAPPTVTIDKQKTVTVALTLLPRSSGALLLPAVPLPWLGTEQQAEFGQVQVRDNVQVNGELRPLPKEVAQIGGFTWGEPLDKLRSQLTDVKVDGERTYARPAPNLDLEFRGGELCAAELKAPNLTLDQARAAFIERWGTPHREDAGERPALVWNLGWTRITATPDTGAVRVQLVREDIEARLARRSVQTTVFGPLDGPAAK